VCGGCGRSLAEVMDWIVAVVGGKKGANEDANVSLEVRGVGRRVRSSFLGGEERVLVIFVKDLESFHVLIGGLRVSGHGRC